jgi:hypothetical protein
MEKFCCDTFKYYYTEKKAFWKLEGGDFYITLFIKRDKPFGPEHEQYYAKYEKINVCPFCGKKLIRKKRVTKEKEN